MVRYGVRRVASGLATGCLAAALATLSVSKLIPLLSGHGSSRAGPVLEGGALILEGILAASLLLRRLATVAPACILLTAAIFGLLAGLQAVAAMPPAQCGCFGALSLKATVGTRLLTCCALAAGAAIVLALRTGPDEGRESVR